jgi:hypothetical protein
MIMLIQMLKENSKSEMVMMNCFLRCLIIFLKIILLSAITTIAYGLTDKDLIPIIRQYDEPCRTDYSSEGNYDLQPFEDLHTKLMGYKNKAGEVVIKPKFDRALTFSKLGIADVFIRPDKWYKIDLKGKILYQSYFFDNGPDYYVSELMRIIEKGKIGFANREGKIIIPPVFEFATPFGYSTPIAMVCKGCQEKLPPKKQAGCCHAEIVGGKWGMINSTGEIIVPIKFDSFGIFEDGSVYFSKEDYVFRIYLKKK